MKPRISEEQAESSALVTRRIADLERRVASLREEYIGRQAESFVRALEAEIAFLREKERKPCSRI